MTIRNKRIFALIFDIFIIGLISSILIPNYTKFISENSVVVFDRTFIYGFYSNFIPYFVYFFIFDIVSNGETFGKMIFKIKVVLADTLNVTLKIRLLRSILKIVSIILLPIAALVFLIKGNTMEDAVCKTITINS